MQNHARNAPNGATATHFVTFLIFGLFSAQKHAVFVFHRHRCGWLPMSLCGNNTLSLSGNHTVSLSGNNTVSLCGNNTVSLSGNHTVSLRAAPSRRIAILGVCVWVGGGGHQWGQSWRDRPPPARRPHSSVWLPHRDTVWLPHKDTVWLPHKDTPNTKP